MVRWHWQLKNLRKLQEIVEDRGDWCAIVQGLEKVGYNLATKPPPPIKHSQGPLAPSQGLWIIFWVISRELVCRYWNPHQVDEVNYMMSRMYSWHKLPQFQELASKAWKQTDPGTEDQLYLKQSRWCRSDHWWPLSRWPSVVLCVCCICRKPPSFVYKSPRPLIVRSEGALAFGQESTLPPAVGF